MDADEARRIYRLMVITAWADGRFDPAESAVTDKLLAEPELQDVTATADLAREAKERLDKLGLRRALEHETQGIVKERELAFYCCARMVEADKNIAFEEFQVFRNLRQLLKLSDADVGRLMAKARAT